MFLPIGDQPHVLEGFLVAMLLQIEILPENLVNHNRTDSPVFFVSVASKGVSVSVSSLLSTLAEDPVSVDSKGI